MIPNHSSANTHAINPQQNASSTPEAAPLSRQRRNVGEPGKYWPQNSTIKVAMYEFDMNEPYVLAVKKAASHWLPHINLTFKFVSGEEGDVRITQNLTNNSGGNSVIGTDALNTTWQPTMSLPSSHLDPTFEDTVMHEFGHMLGAHHAHQHPDANIHWNLPKLESLFSPQQMQDNVLPLPSSCHYNVLPYDADSVMNYSSVPGWTQETQVSAKTQKLSDGDIAWAKKAYPKTQKPDPEAQSSPHAYPNLPAPRATRRSLRRSGDADCTTPRSK